MYLRVAVKVEIITDHNPLRWMRLQKYPRHTFARWILELEEISYFISYRPGSQNRLPDLQPDPIVQDEKEFEDRIFRATALWDGEGIWSKATKQLKTSGKVEWGKLKKVTSHLNIKDGVLYFEQRIVVPKSVQLEVLDKTHSAVHFGNGKTIELLSRNYFWMGMAREAKFWRRCITCQKSKPSNTSRVPFEEFQRRDIGPGEFVAMDIATLLWSDEEYRYFLLVVYVLSAI